MDKSEKLTSGEMPSQKAPLDMTGEEFRRVGYKLVDQIASFLDGIRARKVQSSDAVAMAQQILGDQALPSKGLHADEIMDEVSRLVIEKSLLTAHPRFWAYINGSASPIGALADMLAAAINPNLATWAVGPVASEIERQSVQWIAELMHYPRQAGGLLVSGGTVANITALLAARRAVLGAEIRRDGVGNSPRSRFYATVETHAWLEKAVDIMGFGEAAITRVDTDDQLQMDTAHLSACIAEDRKAGYLPLAVVASAGTVSTGAIDPIEAIAELCSKEKIWFHIDGCYGAAAAVLPSAPADLKQLGLADSIAMDAHKWLYVPLEAGCVLVKDKNHLVDTFAHETGYYPVSDETLSLPVAYRDQGVQTSRGFRALKVWMCLRQAGRDGYIAMIGNNISLAQQLAERITQTAGLELHYQSLSIVTFRYNPGLDPVLNSGLKESTAWSASHRDDPESHQPLNKLNQAILKKLQEDGWAYPSHAQIEGAFLLRVCITNFRTRPEDVDSLPAKVVDFGASLI